MQIISFHLLSISAERKKDSEVDMKVNSDINVSNVQKQDLGINLPEGQEVVSFEFDIKISYVGKQSNMAEILFKGIILASITSEESQELFKSWKNKKIPDNIRVPIFNLVFLKCTVKAMQFEEDLSLPYHIPLPQLTLPKNTQNEKNQKDLKEEKAPSTFNKDNKDIIKSKRDYIG